MIKITLKNKIQYPRLEPNSIHPTKNMKPTFTLFRTFESQLYKSSFMKNLTPISAGVNRQPFSSKAILSTLLAVSLFLLFMASPVLSFAQMNHVPQDQDQIKDAALAQSNFDENVRQTLKANAETIRFMENKGQLSNPDVLYYFEGRHGGVFVERNRFGL